ncbi:7912_t:CDS:2, partial [Funneliformis mosseae]
MEIGLGKKRKSSKLSGGSSIHIHNSTLSGNSLAVAGSTSTTKAIIKRKRELRERKPVSYAEDSTDTDISSDPDYEESRRIKRRFDINGSITAESDYDLSNFERAYQSLDPQKTWTLNSSGRVVEKVIYDHARKFKHDSYLHSFIINDADQEAKKLFNNDEWNEIFSTNLKQVPNIDKNITDFLKNTQYTNYLPFKKLYLSMYSLWEGESNFNSSSKLEGWFEMNVWAHLVDPAFRGMEIELRNNHLEFGAIEAGRNWEGSKGTKFLTDSLKMCKMLKDILNELASECNMKEDIVRKLQTAGILQGANMMQLITVDLPMGYVTRICRRKFYEVPSRLSNYQSFAFIIMEVLALKSIIKRTFNLVNESIDFEQFLESYYENDKPQTPPRNSVSLTSSTHTTPKKNELKIFKILFK